MHGEIVWLTQRVINMEEDVERLHRLAIALGSGAETRLGGVLKRIPIVRRWFYARAARRLERLHLFDREFYRQTNPDVTRGKGDPAVHFVVHGIAEGRAPKAYWGFANHGSRPAGELENGR